MSLNEASSANIISFYSKAESGSNQDIPISLEDKEQVVEDSEDDVEIVEDENGQCTVRIKPKPIKLKIINPYATPNALPNKSTQAKKRKLSTEDHDSSNGLLNESEQFEQNIPTAKKARQDSESTSKTLGRPKTPTQRDTRTHCDKVCIIMTYSIFPVNNIKGKILSKKAIINTQLRFKF